MTFDSANDEKRTFLWLDTTTIYNTYDPSIITANYNEYNDTIKFIMLKQFQINILMKLILMRL